MSIDEATKTGLPWYRTLNATQWKTLLASNLGCSPAPTRWSSECASQSWCDPAGGSPAQVRSSVRLVASVAQPLVTVVAKRTQRLHGVWD